MEGVPPHLDYEAIGRALAELPGVVDVHDLHVWNMTSEGVALSAHIGLANGKTWLTTLGAARRMLAQDYDIHHSTLQPSWPAVAPGGDERIIPLVAAADTKATRS